MLLREVPARAGSPGAALLADALAGSSARCRLYVLSDLAAAPDAPPLAAALVEIEGHGAILVRASVGTPRTGLRARLFTDLRAELRACGVRTFKYESDAELEYDAPDVQWCEQEL